MANQVSDAIAFARTAAHTDSQGITDADGLTMATDALFELQLLACRKREDLFLQESSRDITSVEIIGGASPGKFLFPTDMLFWKQIEINLVDPTQQSLFILITPNDVSNPNANSSFDWLRINQPSSTPLIDSHGDWFEVFPTPIAALTGAIKMLYFLIPTAYAATTDYVSYPYSIDIRAIAYKIGAFYARLNKDFDLMKELDGKSEQRLDYVLSVLSGSQSQVPRRPQGLPYSGYEV